MSRVALGKGFLLAKNDPKRIPPVKKPPPPPTSPKTSKPSEAQASSYTQPTNLDPSALEDVDYYKALGVSEAATAIEIKAAFRQQVNFKIFQLKI